MRTHTHLELRYFRAIKAQLRRAMIERGSDVHTDTWQGSDISKRPEAEMRELLNVTIHVPQVAHRLENLQRDIEPNLPWADDHFEERVCGWPINPGIEWANWPWGKSAADFLTVGQFNHNYMERLWPKLAGKKSATYAPHDWQGAGPRGDLNFGIRGPYGDLYDLIDLIDKDPHTRQAWVPLFFPEDTGVGDGGRKPCTLGYQFMLRDGKIHTYYPLRSCDLVRHWADDVYLALRLALWVKEKSKSWANYPLGSFTMHMTSLHCFKNDLRGLENEKR